MSGFGGMTISNKSIDRQEMILDKEYDEEKKRRKDTEER